MKTGEKHTRGVTFRLTLIGFICLPTWPNYNTNIIKASDCFSRRSKVSQIEIHFQDIFPRHVPRPTQDFSKTFPPKAMMFQKLSIWIVLTGIFISTASGIHLKKEHKRSDDAKKDQGLVVNNETPAKVSAAAAAPAAEAHEADEAEELSNHGVHSHDWGYKNDGDSQWAEGHKECGGKRQSPINIERSKVQHMRDFQEIIFSTSHGKGGAYLVNNGHTASITFNDRTDLVWGRLGNPYMVVGIHFHWGKNDKEGSEHRIDGKAYPLEMHIVTYDAESYASVEEALGEKDSLAVYGVFFELSDSDNEILHPIIDVLHKADDLGDKVLIKGLNLTDLLPGHYSTRYYTYLGSLTTPPCTESVIWILGERKLTISSDQLRELRKLSTNPGSKPRAAAIMDEGQASEHVDKQQLDSNWRKPQEIYGREVLASFVEEEGHAEPDLQRSGTGAQSQGFWTCALLAVVAHLWRKL